MIIDAGEPGELDLTDVVTYWRMYIAPVGRGHRLQFRVPLEWREPVQEFLSRPRGHATTTFTSGGSTLVHDVNRAGTVDPYSHRGSVTFDLPVVLVVDCDHVPFPSN